MDLLPTNFDEFRSEKYWDGFFRKRRSEAFEWYGTWAEIRGAVGDACRPEDDVLVVGCGNSELSSELYDSGIERITNVDFSKVVISEMMRKNLRCRPKMKWLVKDMTDTKFPANSFSVVFDKGGLDALMGEPGAASDQVGTRLLTEVDRLLAAGGRYLCVTLGQEHVIALLVSSFRQNWKIELRQIAPPPGGEDSTLQPFLAAVTKGGAAPGWQPDGGGAMDLARGNCPALVEASLPRDLAGRANREQLEALLVVVDRENKFRSQFLPSSPSEEQQISPTPDGTLPDPVDFTKLAPGRRLERQLADGRFSAVILDSEATLADAALPCGVFLVPQGREHEWLFAEEEGQWQLQQSAGAARLIIVTLNRGHSFASSEGVQAELSPLVLPFATHEGLSTRIPYMTTGDGVGRRKAVATVQSAISGEIVVEDVELASGSSAAQGAQKDETGGPSLYRRLIFLRNPNLVQSEALLLAKLPPPPQKAAKKPARKKAKAGSGAPSVGSGAELAVGVERLRLGGAELARGDRGADVAAAAEAGTDVAEGDRNVQVEHSYLASDYQAGMVAGLALIGPEMARCRDESSPMTALVIGAGGGLLPMFLRNHFPFSHLEVVELDECVADLAKKYFGFVEDDRMKLRICDGLAAVRSYAETISSAQSAPATSAPSSEGVPPAGTATEHDAEGTERDPHVHFLVVDADSGDSSLGMSCPPPEFLSIPFLQSAKTLLHERGLFAVNVVARAAAPYAEAKRALLEVFGEVYELNIDGDVNRVLFALPTQSHVRTLPGGILGCAVRTASLAAAHAPWGQGPSLVKFAPNIQLLSKD